MKSIKMKFFIIYTLTLVLLIVLFLVINNSFLKKFYVYHLEKDFVRHYETIIDMKSMDDLNKYLSELTRNEGIHSMVIDRQNNILFDSLIIRPQLAGLPKQNIPLKKVPKYIGSIIMKNKQMGWNEYYYDTVYAENKKEEVLFFSLLEQHNYIVMYKSVYIINENAWIANQFFIYVSLGLMILGSIFILLFSNKVTKPIIELKEITEKIADQDFSHKFQKKSEDEIGQLGENINYMSDKLDEAMATVVLANEQLKKDIERKEAIDHMRKNFIASVSHELKTPIGLIKGYVEAIKFRVVESEEEKKSYFDVIINETDKMNKMLRELLNLSTLESEVDELNISVFNMAVLIDEVSVKFHQVFEEKKIKLDKKVHDDLFTKADYVKIEQVLTNFLTNAINHVDNEKEIKISLSSIDNKVVVSVYNSGNNIPENEIEHIWESFYKVDKARTRKYGGTGLGLSIVRIIVEKHQGDYGVRNYENGVEFWFSIDEHIGAN